MSLRTKLIILLVLLATLPPLGVSAFDHARALRAVTAFIGSETALLAQQSATEIADRYTTAQANAELLAGNSAVEWLYAGNHGRQAADFSAATAYLARAWATMGSGFSGAVYRDLSGRAVYSLGDSALDPPGGSPAYSLERTVRDSSGKPIGTLTLTTRLDSLLPAATLGARMGRSGSSYVLGASGTSVYSSASPMTDRAPAPVLRTMRTLSMATGDRPTTTIEYTDGDSTRVASLARVAATPLTVVAVGTLDEFTGPFARDIRSNVALLLAIAFLLACACTLMVFRITNSLTRLTIAADRVTAGNLTPPLPLGGSQNEVDRLSRAFAAMLARIRQTMQELETSRQFAAVGRFASQVAHELRNPLTGIKLNLQRLERAADTGELPETLRKPLRICLAEVDRLDGVVRGILRLGRAGAGRRDVLSLHDVIRGSVVSLRDELEARNTAVTLHLDAPDDRVHGDAMLLHAAVVNVLANAAESGATCVDVRTFDDADRMVIDIVDDGAGIPPADRERIFEPFYSTKPEGTGLGLSLVQRTLEEHRGRVEIESPVRQSTGSRVRMSLPVARVP